MYFHLFKSDKNNQWYWSLKADNHATIADGSEGYVNKQGAINGINLVKKNAASSQIWDSEARQWI